ncbi:MAG: signal recognition particle-docking protein FtsY [Rickettsiales bacterium]|jgi:fused signal recognition particle receptor
MSSGGWLSRLKAGLAKSSSRLVDGIAGVFTRRRLDDAAVQELEDVLISADLGPATAARLAGGLAARRIDREVDAEEIRALLADDIADILAPVAVEPMIASEHKPHVVMVVGVNGTGKTTTIGKLAKRFVDEGRSVVLAAGDTFRAAAIEQLGVWGERTGCPVISSKIGSDASGLVYEAVEKARSIGADMLLIDTAGRLHNKTDLMAELEKIQRVIRKLDPSAPHEVLLVLDATTGQNAIAQVETFGEMVSITGLVVTKLDGTAKGGVLVALADRFGLPVRAIGVGEGIDDLRPFSAREYARNLMGLEPENPAP